MSSAEKKWMYRRPLVVGYYWWQKDERSAPEIVHLSCDREGYWFWWAVMIDPILSELFTDEDDAGRWYGPITPPSSVSAFEPREEAQ